MADLGRFVIASASHPRVRRVKNIEKRLSPTKSNLNRFLMNIFDWTLRIMGKDPKGKSLSRWMSTATHGSLLLSRVLRVPVPHFYGISANWSRAERLSGWFLDANPLEDWDMSLKNVLKASLWWEMMMFMFFPLSNLKMMSTFWEGFWCTLSYCINA